MTLGDKINRIGEILTIAGLIMIFANFVIGSAGLIYPTAIVLGTGASIMVASNFVE